MDTNFHTQSVLTWTHVSRAMSADMDTNFHTISADMDTNFHTHTTSADIDTDVHAQSVLTRRQTTQTKHTRMLTQPPHPTQPYTHSSLSPPPKKVCTYSVLCDRYQSDVFFNDAEGMFLLGGADARLGSFRGYMGHVKLYRGSALRLDQVQKWCVCVCVCV